MLVEELNAMSEIEVHEVLRSCVDIDSWVAGVAAGRPYADVAQLVGRADDLARGWTPTDLDRALADHPRIGERHSGSGASAAMSSSEQAGVGDDADVQARLADGNRRYEAAFDRIYLVRAKGRSAEEMLAMLEERLGNDPETEREVTLGQLREIALLRLEGLFA